MLLVEKFVCAENIVNKQQLFCSDVTKLVKIRIYFDFQNSLNANANRGIYLQLDRNAVV